MRIDSVLAGGVTCLEAPTGTVTVPSGWVVETRLVVSGRAAHLSCSRTWTAYRVGAATAYAQPSRRRSAARGPTIAARSRAAAVARPAGLSRMTLASVIDTSGDLPLGSNTRATLPRLRDVMLSILIPT